MFSIKYHKTNLEPDIPPYPGIQFINGVGWIQCQTAFISIYITQLQPGLRLKNRYIVSFCLNNTLVDFIKMCRRHDWIIQSVWMTRVTTMVAPIDGITFFFCGINTEACLMLCMRHCVVKPSDMPLHRHSNSFFSTIVRPNLYLTYHILRPFK